MTVKTNMIEEFSFSNEDNVLSACSGALRKVSSLAEIAPIGRLFASITTLSEAAHQINQSLAANDLASAAKLMKSYAQPAAPAKEEAPLPVHFKRRG